jgi:hypothetical protein
VAGPIDAIGFGWCALIVLAVAGLVAAAWQTFPAWLPRRSWLGWWRALRARWPWWRRRRRERPIQAGAVPDATADPVADQLPDVPSATLTSLADAFAAQGRYAEAVRERLRAMIRELVDAGVITHRPALTILELSRTAARARPPMGPAVGGASRIFSDIWYGERPATADDDAAMREYAGAVRAQVRERAVAR